MYSFFFYFEVFSFLFFSPFSAYVSNNNTMTQKVLLNKKIIKNRKRTINKSRTNVNKNTEKEMYPLPLPLPHPHTPKHQNTHTHTDAHVTISLHKMRKKRITLSRQISTEFPMCSDERPVRRLKIFWRK